MVNWPVAGHQVEEMAVALAAQAAERGELGWTKETIEYDNQRKLMTLGSDLRNIPLVGEAVQCHKCRAWCRLSLASREGGPGADPSWNISHVCTACGEKTIVNQRSLETLAQQREDEANRVTLVYRVPRRVSRLERAFATVKAALEFSEDVLPALVAYVPLDPNRDVYLAFTIQIKPEADPLFTLLHESALKDSPGTSLESLADRSKFVIWDSERLSAVEGLSVARNLAVQNGQE